MDLVFILGTAGGAPLDGDASLLFEVHRVHLCVDALAATHLVDLVNPPYVSFFGVSKEQWQEASTSNKSSMFLCYIQMNQIFYIMLVFGILHQMILVKMQGKQSTFAVPWCSRTADGELIWNTSLPPRGNNASTPLHRTNLPN